MSSASQKQAIKNYRKRLMERGMARFEVLGRATDRELIRVLAQRMAESGPEEAAQLRAAISQAIANHPPSKGRILSALRRSPLVGEEIETARSFNAGRSVDL